MAGALIKEAATQHRSRELCSFSSQAIIAYIKTVAYFIRFLLLN